MNNEIHLYGTSSKPSLQRHFRLHNILLMAMLGCSTATAGTGVIPTDQDKYPSEITSAPAAVSQCLACHGPTGQGVYEEWPKLAGQKQAYLRQQLEAFKSGERKHPMMQPVVVNLSEDDIEKATYYMSAQTPAQPTDKARSLLKKSTTPASVSTCVACHDDPSLRTEPFLHGQYANYLAAQLHAYKNGTRKNEVMEEMAKDLSDKEIDAFARYFSAQTPVPPVRE